MFPKKKKSEDEIIAEIANKDVTMAEHKEKAESKDKKTSAKKKTTATKVSVKKDSVSMPTFAGSVGQGNHNEKILALHNEGKSNVAIAKQLGLGVGEVKLVIDLYQQS